MKYNTIPTPYLLKSEFELQQTPPVDDLQIEYFLCKFGLLGSKSSSLGLFLSIYANNYQI